LKNLNYVYVDLALKFEKTNELINEEDEKLLRNFGAE
jgi:hypothetical protein